MSKNSPGNFFEDFRVRQVIRHATPRTMNSGDVALYNGLFGSRFAVQSSDVFAKAIGYPCAPIDDLLATLDWCRLHLAVRWVGWAPSWSPPREHRHDWLREALSLAEEVEI